jgi:hypothetical protein
MGQNEYRSWPWNGLEVKRGAVAKALQKKREGG